MKNNDKKLFNLIGELRGKPTLYKRYTNEKNFMHTTCSKIRKDQSNSE